jgi:hypothetical protein
MFKRLALFALMLLLLLTQMSVALAQGPTPRHAEGNWQATYWNNMSLSGTAVLQRAEATLNYNWDNNSPAPGTVDADHFSVRWTRYIDEPDGAYRFTATSDDGMRLWVDGVLLVDDWSDHPARTRTADTVLGEGHHLITVEYYENAGQAVASLSWAPAPVNIANWRGEYFNNADLAGSPVLVRDDAQINFNWGTGSPAPGVVPADNFSTRWTRTLNLPAGNYRFTTTVDDGVRLRVNNHLLVDAWQVQSAHTFTGDLYLPGGAVSISMEYFEAAAQAVASLSWTTVGTPSPSPPPPYGSTVVVENGDAGFVKGGNASSWRTANIGYNGNLLWTRNNNTVRSGYNWAHWYPSLAAGPYEVFVYVPDNYANTEQARYWISHRDGYTLRVVNQSIYSNQWVSLGTYRFRGSSADYVSLADVTFETYLSRMIAFDAVKWEPR